MKTLVLGGARSGKSHYAQQLAIENDKPVVYIATATANDDEMQLRIEQHKKDRPENWQLIEEPVKLAEVLLQQDQNNQFVLVDCLTLWLSNVLASYEKPEVEQKSDQLVQVVDEMSSDLVLVSNEVGLGVVPMGELSRHFVDEAGRLHQRLAQVCDRVIFTVAGLPQILK